MPQTFSDADNQQQLASQEETARAAAPSFTLGHIARSYLTVNRAATKGITSAYEALSGAGKATGEDLAQINRHDFQMAVMKPVFGVMRMFGGETERRADLQQENMEEKGSESTSGMFVREAGPYFLKTGALTAVAGPGAVGYTTWLALDALTDGVYGYMMEDPDEWVSWFAEDSDLNETQKRALNAGAEAAVNIFGEAFFGGWRMLQKGLNGGDTSKLIDDLMAATDDIDGIINRLAIDDPENFTKYYDDRQLFDIAPDLAISKRARALGLALKQMEDRIAAGQSPLPVDQSAARKRLATYISKTEGDGFAAPVKNMTRRITSADGTKSMVIGHPTNAQWMERVTETLDPEEILAAAQWYDDVGRVFTETFGEKYGPVMAAAWSISNQLVTPATAQHNVMRSLEKILGEVTSKKKAGLTDEKLRQFFTGEINKMLKGNGQKLMDFLDASFGREARSIMGGDPRGGAPVVVDGWAYLDYGRVAKPKANEIKRVYGVDLDIDTVGETPTPGQYEAIGNWYRQLADDMNRTAFAGRTDWTPSRAQAVGWMTMQRKLGKEGQTAEEAILYNMHSIAFEAKPGDHSQFAAAFGEKYASLPLDSQVRVARDLTQSADSIARQISGTHDYMQVEGIGGWMDEINPSTTDMVIASHEAAELHANVLGYLLQQQSVATWVPDPSGKDIAIEIFETAGDMMETPVNKQAFWKYLTDADDEGILLGFSSARNAKTGKAGLSIIVEGGAQVTTGKKLAKLQEIVQAAADKSGIDVDASLVNARAKFTGNPHGDGFDGESYLAWIRQTYGNEAADLVRSRGDEFAATWPKALDAEGARLNEIGQGDRIQQSLSRKGVENPTGREIGSGGSLPRGSLTALRKPGSNPPVTKGMPAHGAPGGLRAKYVAGVRSPGGPDVPLSPDELHAVAKRLATIIRAAPLPGAKGRLSSNRLSNEAILELHFDDVMPHWRINNLGDFLKVAKASPEVFNTFAHETGHLIDFRTGFEKLEEAVNAAQKAAGKPDLFGSADKIVHQLQELSRHQRAWMWGSREALINRVATDNSVPIDHPKVIEYADYIIGYRRQPDELVADGLASYMKDPEFTKDLAPDWVDFVQFTVNDNPQLRDVIQFNEIFGAALAGGAAAAAARSEGDDDERS